MAVLAIEAFRRTSERTLGPTDRYTYTFVCRFSSAEYARSILTEKGWISYYLCYALKVRTYGCFITIYLVGRDIYVSTLDGRYCLVYNLISRTTYEYVLVTHTYTTRNKIGR